MRRGPARLAAARRSFLALRLGAALLLAGAQGVPVAAVAGLDLARACAAFDLNALMLIEDQGWSRSSDPAMIAAALVTLLDARVACRGGDGTLAFALYDRATLDRAPHPVAWADRR